MEKNPYPVVHPDPSLSQIVSCWRTRDYVEMFGITAALSGMTFLMTHRRARSSYTHFNNFLIFSGMFSYSYIKGVQRFKGFRQNDVEVEKYGVFSDENLKDYLMRSKEYNSEFIRPSPKY